MATPAQRPWLSSYAKGVPADVPIPTEPVHAALERAALLYGDRPALDFMGKTTSYAKLWRQVRVAAQGLADRGVGRGTIVAIALPNCPQHVVAFYAVMRLGAVVVEHNPTYTAEQFEGQLKDSGATCVIAMDTITPMIASVVDRELVDVISVNLTKALTRVKQAAIRIPLPSLRALRKEMTAGPDRTIDRWERVATGNKPLPRTYPGPKVEDVALLQYTGGTTGTPKGAILTHANVVVNAMQSVAWVPGLKQGQEVFYGALPFFHSFGLTLCLTVPAHLASLLVVFPKFSTTQVLTAQRRVPGTFFAGVPPMFDRLEKAAAGANRRHRLTDLSSFGHAISGGMALPGDVAERWEAATGGLLIEGYGMTETSPIILGNPASSARRPGTLGIPFPNSEYKIVDVEDPTTLVEPGESGELLVRGPQVFRGYWRRPQETAACLSEDGWLRTGDVVVREPDGFVRLVDRIKEVILTGGYNVYPSQVEEHLAQMPQIDEVAVVGVPGGDLGERVVAAVVLAAGAKLDLEQVRTWCARKLSRYAIPMDIIQVKTLPRSQVGKVLRRVVRLEILAKPKAKPEVASS
jgi:long-chain acyl-CoA synthetase